MSVQLSTIPTGVRLSAGMTCPRCGGPMVVVSSTAAATREWKSIMRCDGCAAEQLLWLRLVDISA